MGFGGGGGAGMASTCFGPSSIFGGSVLGAGGGGADTGATAGAGGAAAGGGGAAAAGGGTTGAGFGGSAGLAFAGPPMSVRMASRSDRMDWMSSGWSLFGSSAIVRCRRPTIL